MDPILSVALGLGIAAACGFRVFLPLLVVGIAARNGLVPLSGSFEWMASGTGLLTLGTAAGAEVLAYFIPWLDNLLDALATPAAVLAGILGSAAVLGVLPPEARWAVAVIGGGGAAGLVQGATVVLRAGSSASTGGAGNPLVAVLELLGSLATVLVAIFLPLVALLGVLALAVVGARGVVRVVRGRRHAAS